MLAFKCKEGWNKTSITDDVIVMDIVRNTSYPIGCYKDVKIQTLTSNHEFDMVFGASAADSSKNFAWGMSNLRFKIIERLFSPLSMWILVVRPFCRSNHIGRNVHRDDRPYKIQKYKVNCTSWMDSRWSHVELFIIF